MSEALRGPGSVIASYEILEELGRGGLGIVYRSRHLHLGRLVALKVLHPYWTASREFLERFREEGRVMALLEHPSILRVYDAGEADGIFFLAMRYLEGETLEELIKDGIPLEQAVGIARQLASALAYAHARGIIHRDVKPANVVVGPQGEATLMDFGVARLKDAPGMTLPGVQVGTPFYMAPEQIVGKPLDGRADVYALGVVLYQMISGQLPFPGPDTEPVFHGHIYEEPPPLSSDCPEWLRRVVRKALEKSPDDRLQNADSFLLALESDGDEEVLGRAGVSGETAAPARGPGSTGPRSRQAAPQATLVKRERTALSLDVVGSSRMKRPGLTMAVQHQFALFRDYVRTKLEEHACLACSWSGDGLLALFAKPGEATACGRSILDGLDGFNTTIEATAEPIRVRIGVHDGSVLMSDDQPLGEVTSSTLDVAGHLQKSSPENTILISASTHERLADPASWTAAGRAPQLDIPVYRYGQVEEARPRSAPATASPGQPAAGVLRLRVSSAGKEHDHEVRREALIGRPDSGSGRIPEISLEGDEAVSRRHARIFADGGRFFLEDLDSTNGTKFNDRWLRPLAPEPLEAGDRLEVGEGTHIEILGITLSDP